MVQLGIQLWLLQGSTHDILAMLGLFKESIALRGPELLRAFQGCRDLVLGLVHLGRSRLGLGLRLHLGLRREAQFFVALLRGGEVVGTFL